MSKCDNRGLQVGSGDHVEVVAWPRQCPHVRGMGVASYQVAESPERHLPALLALADIQLLIPLGELLEVPHDLPVDSLANIGVAQHLAAQEMEVAAGPLAPGQPLVEFGGERGWGEGHT